MTPLVLLITALVGGLGAVCRFVLDGVIRSGLERPGRSRDGTPSAPLPWPTITVNFSGSLVLGVVVGLSFASVLPPGWEVVVGAGFLGGYTTFSTAAVEAVRLAQAGRWSAAAATAIGVLVASTAAAGLGVWAGGLVAGALWAGGLAG